MNSNEESESSSPEIIITLTQHAEFAKSEPSVTLTQQADTADSELRVTMNQPETAESLRKKKQGPRSKLDKWAEKKVA